jgi:hypothetical protein
MIRLESVDENGQSYLTCRENSTASSSILHTVPPEELHFDEYDVQKIFYLSG